VPVAWLAANEGGYFPEAWPGPTLVLLWVAMLALILAKPVLPGRFALSLLGAAAALVLWIGVSTTWSTLPSQSVLELERALLYLAALVAVMLLLRGHALAALAGVTAAIALVGGYALAVRLFPHLFGTAERRPFQTAALFEPIGYSNALGVFAAVGAVLALGFAADGRSRLSRALATVGVVVLAQVVYFTFSRGAWLALVIGLAAAVGVAPERSRLLRAWLVGPLPFAALGVTLASHADALNRVNPRLEDAAREGALLFAALVLLAALAVATRLTVRPSAAGVAIAAVVIVAAGLTFSRDTPSRPSASLRTEQGASVALGRRDEFWRAAWNAFEERPVTGIGAGAYEQYWLQHREHPRNVRDAHNLYLEVLAELGIPGLVLIALLFGIPLAAGVVARTSPVVPAAVGALAAYLAHAAVDWDWEVPALTVTALLVAAALACGADERREPLLLSPSVRAAAIAGLLVASVFAVVALVGNRAAANGERALRVGAASAAEAEARRAVDWTPWSSHPLRTLANAQLLQDEREAARKTVEDALEKGDRDWRLWLALAIATEGAAQRAALDEAQRLNPLSQRLEEVRRNLRQP
jgi:O-antigen ligase